MVVIERRGQSYLNPANSYGARRQAGALLFSEVRARDPMTIPTFRFMPIQALTKLLKQSRRTQPFSRSSSMTLSPNTLAL